MVFLSKGQKVDFMFRFILFVSLFCFAGCQIRIGGESERLEVSEDLQLITASKAQLTVFASGPLERGLVYLTSSQLDYFGQQKNPPKIQKLILPLEANRMTVCTVDLVQPVSTIVLYVRGPDSYGWSAYKIKEGKVVAHINRAFNR